MRAKPVNFLKIFLFFFFLASYFYLLLFFLAGQNNRSPQPVPVPESTAPSTEKVARVIDGDTFEIQGGIKVRLIGVDTPEMKNKNKTTDCFAGEAKKRMESLISNKEVILEKDISETDKYGRLLRYVYLDGQMINELLVKEGFAKISTFPPDVKYKDLYLAGEILARENKLGLWSACK